MSIWVSLPPDGLVSAGFKFTSAFPLNVCLALGCLREPPYGNPGLKFWSSMTHDIVCNRNITFTWPFSLLGYCNMTLDSWSIFFWWAWTRLGMHTRRTVGQILKG